MLDLRSILRNDRLYDNAELAIGTDANGMMFTSARCAPVSRDQNEQRNCVCQCRCQDRTKIEHKLAITCRQCAGALGRRRGSA